MGIIANYKIVTLEELNYLKNCDGKATCEFLYEGCIDIEKSWDVLKYILTGSSRLTGNVLDNIIPMKFENIVNEVDMGMGPAYYIDKDTVKEMSVEMEKFTEDVFKSKIDVDKMGAERILSGWNFESVFEYAYSYFKILKEYFKRASSECKYIVVWLD